jgi:hypothetical protein
MRKTVRLKEKQNVTISREVYAELCSIFGKENIGFIGL